MQKSRRESFDPWSLPVPSADEGRWQWSPWLISHICPLRSKTATFTDIRIRTMNEVITGIRIIKMYAWEKPFADLITDLRR